MTPSTVSSPVRFVRGGFDKSTDNLWAEQRLSWQGSQLSEDAWKSLPETMLSVHFSEVQRALGGILRCRRVRGRTVCTLPGGAPALVFDKADMELTDDCAMVTLQILGGILARGSKNYGALSIGVSRVQADNDRVEYSAWQVVQDYPSRFLHVSRFVPINLAAGIVGKIYRAYHSAVTYRSLHRIQAVLERSALHQ